MSPVQTPEPSPSPSSLRDEVHQTYRGVTAVSIALAALLLVLVGLLPLRAYVLQNLDLMARSLAYTVEAALVFDDRTEAGVILSQLVSTEQVAQATVFDAQKTTFVHWERGDTSLRARMGARLGRWMWLPSATAPIRSGHTDVGWVELRSDGQGLLQFLLNGVTALLVCLALAAGAGWLLSRRLLRDIVTPLQQLAQVARAARHDRALDQRVPPARIAELRSLGDDLNALLQELQQRYAQLEHQNATLAHRAQHDSLTGLPNRDHFEDRLDAALHEMRASKGAMAVLFLDTDRFKDVNDHYGHAAGDQLLTEVARRIRAELRESDLVARMGGDEFAVLLAPLRGSADALRIADKILHAMGAPMLLDTLHQVTPSVSIGVAVFPEHGSTASELLRAADSAMYQAKRTGGATRHMGTPTPSALRISADEQT